MVGGITHHQAGVHYHEVRSGRASWLCHSGVIFMHVIIYFKQLRVSTRSVHLYNYTPVLYTSVCINEVLVKSNSTFVCLPHEAAEQCGHVL